MKRKKRITIKLVAVGLAVAALAAPPAMARLDEGLGVQAQPATRVVSPDDRATSRVSPVPAQPSIVATDDGFELGALGMSGIVLLLGAGGAVLAVNHSRKGKLASV